MTERVGQISSSPMQNEVQQEFGEVVDALKQAFPQKNELEILKALDTYVAEQGNVPAKDLDPQAMLDHITKAFNVSLSAEAASSIKTEWEELTQGMAVGVSDMAQVLDTYTKDSLLQGDREYLVLLWQMLQGEMEEAVGEETTVTAKANKSIQKEKMEEFIEKKIEETKKSESAGFWGKLAKWAGVVACCIGAALACAVAAVAISTGVGAPVGAMLIIGAACLVALALNNTVSAVSEECGHKIDLFAEAGRGIAKLLNAMGMDIDEDEFAMWFSFGVQMALTVTAIICTAGTASATAGISGAVTATNVTAAACSIASGVTQGVSTIKNYELAISQADLLELAALLDKLSETRNMEQELTASILSKIFEAIRGQVADSMDSIVSDMEMISGINLQRG